MTDIFEALAAPLPSIHWRSQAINKEGNSAMALAYMDARDVMNRLDAIVGPDSWQDSYEDAGKRLICTISIRIGDQWVSKSDGAGDTAVEGEKGGISDAFKRAAVKWGIGRYLYDMPTPWAECTSYERNGKRVFKAWTEAGLRKLAEIERTICPPKNEAEAPNSVKTFLKLLRGAMNDGTAEQYWKSNYPPLPDNWKPFVTEQKEVLKAANTNEPANNLQAG